MSIVLNDPGCTVLGGNTGMPSCILNPKNIVGALLINKDKVFTGSDIATVAAWITAVQALCLGPFATRAFPIFGFDALTDNTEDVSIKTLGYGSRRPVRDPKYDLTFEMNLGINYNNKLRRFNDDRGKKVIFFDANNNVIATKYGTSGDFTGFSLDFIFAYPVKMDDGGENPAQYRLRFGLTNPKEMNDDICMFPLGADAATTFKGIMDVTLTELAHGADYITVGLKESITGISLYDTYSTDLAVAGAWVVTKARVAVTPSAVAKDATLGGWKISLTTPSGAHVVALEDPTALEALGVGGSPDEGYEGENTLSITF